MHTVTLPVATPCELTYRVDDVRRDTAPRTILTVFEPCQPHARHMVLTALSLAKVATSRLVSLYEHVSIICVAQTARTMTVWRATRTVTNHQSPTIFIAAIAPSSNCLS